MRSFLLAMVAIAAVTTTMTVETSDANAVVCARGVFRAGCVGARGAVVVHRPLAHRAVVAGCECPSSLPMIGNPKPAPAP